MAGGTAVLKISVITDTKQAKKGLEDTAGATAKVGTSLKKIGGAVAAGFAIGAVVQFGKASVQAATDAAKSTARLDQVFKSMGDTTGQASKHAQDYASSLSKQIGVEDDVIMAGQAMLATFGNVSNAAARAAGIFDRATAAGADLAAAGFGTIESNAVQLGKALQDPIHGLTALGRSGVTFTAAQKQQIDAMQKSGDLLGAQKVVLAAVETQVQGTAAATASAADKQKVAYGELQESIGRGLLPVIEKLQGTLTGLFDFIAANANWLVPVVLAIALLAVAVKGIILASQLWTAANVILGASELAVLWPIALIVAGLAAVIIIIILLWNKCAWFRDAVTTAWKAIQIAFGWILDAAKSVFNWIRANWPALLAILTGPFGIAALLIARNWDTIRAGAAAVLAFIGGMPGRIGGALAGLAHIIAGPFIAGFDAIKAALQATIDWIANKIAAIKNIVSSGISAAKNLYNEFARTWNGFEVTIGKIEVAGKTVYGGGTIGLPDLPMLASGAYVNRAMLAVVGEGTGGEWVLPDRLLRRELGRAGGNTYHVAVRVDPTANRAEVGRAVVDAIRAFERAAGHTWRTG